MKLSKKTEEFFNISQRYEPSCLGWPANVVWERGRGAEIWDVDGNHYIDWTSGVLVANVGHAHPHLAESIASQAQRLLNPFDFPTPERLKLAQKIIEMTPSHLDKVIFVSTGTEATDAALRMAKRYTKKYEILSFWGGFHGKTLGPLSVAGSTNTKRNFGPIVPGAVFTPYPYCYRCPFENSYPDCDMFCVEYLDRVIQAESVGSLAALIIEPYQGYAGFIFPPEGYLKRIEEWAKNRNILFILDEIQSSYGRTGKMWALEHEKLEPDILCLGKGMGSGLPIAAVVSSSEIFSSLDVGEMSSTTGGNPLSCAGALAVIEIIKREELVKKVAENGEHLKEKLLRIKDKYRMIGDIRGRGLVYGIEFVKDRETKESAPDIARDVVLKCIENGLMVGKVGLYGNVMRVAPPLVITPELIDRSVFILDKVLSGF